MESITNFITYNFWYKFTSLVIAIVIWSIVQGEEIVEVNRKLNVRIEVPDGYLVKGDAMRMKDITIRFPRFLQAEITDKNFEARINIPDGKTGEHRFRVDKEYINGWDNRFKLVVHDAYVVVNVDEKLSKEFPVREVLQGSPAAGYNIEKVVIKPDTINITGLKSELSKIQDVVTDMIDVNGIKETKTLSIPLVTQGLSNRSLSPDTVEVTVQVGESKINQVFEGIPVLGQGGDYVSSIKPKMVNVVLQASPRVMATIDKSELQAFVELHSLLPGLYSKQVQARIPQDTVLIETQPSAVKVEVYNQKKIQ